MVSRIPGNDGGSPGTGAGNGARGGVRIVKPRSQKERDEFNNSHKIQLEKDAASAKAEAAKAARIKAATKDKASGTLKSTEKPIKIDSSKKVTKKPATTPKNETKKADPNEKPPVARKPRFNDHPQARGVRAIRAAKIVNTKTADDARRKAQGK